MREEFFTACPAKCIAIYGLYFCCRQKRMVYLSFSRFNEGVRFNSLS